MATNWDLVDEAGLESFPASDPPAWGSSHAAPSETTTCPPELLQRRRLVQGMRIGLGLVAVGILAGALLVIWRVRA